MGRPLRGEDRDETTLNKGLVFELNAEDRREIADLLLRGKFSCKLLVIFASEGVDKHSFQANLTYPEDREFQDEFPFEEDL